MRALLLLGLIGGVASADRWTDEHRATMRELGNAYKPRELTGPATAGCRPVSKSERKALEIETHAFIDAEHPDELQWDDAEADVGWVFDVGCREPNGTVYISASQDRMPKVKPKDRFPSLRRNFLLAIDVRHRARVIAEDQGASSEAWFNAEERGFFAIVAQLDIDGDGTRDLLWSHVEMPGWTPTPWSHVTAQLGNGTTVDLGRIRGLVTKIVGGKLTFGASDSYERHATSGCIDAKLALVHCPEATWIHELQRYNAAVDALRNPGGDDDDRDYYAAAFTALGIKDRTVLAALPETTARQRAARHAKAFLVAAGLDDAWNQVIDHPHPEATAYMTKIAAQLGDTPCTISPLDPAIEEKLRAFARTKAGTRNVNISVAAECGSYAWVQYSRENDSRIYTDLVTTAGREISLVHQFSDLAEWSFAPLAPEFHYTGNFFTHGSTLVGWVVRDENEKGNLYLIANNKVVATSHGDFQPYKFDDRWPEQSFDLLLETGNGMHHATPTGFARIDPEQLRDHDAWRDAVDTLRMCGDPDMKPATIAAALRRLGADARLIAEWDSLAKG